MSVVVDNNIVKGYATRHDGADVGWNEFHFTRGNYVYDPSVTRLDNSNYLVSFTVKTDPNSASSMGHILHCYAVYCNGFIMETHPDWNPSVANSYLFAATTSGVVDHVRTAKLTNNRFISVFASNKPEISPDYTKSIFGMIWTYSTEGGDLSGSNSPLNEYSNSRGTPFKINDFSGDKHDPEVAGFSDGGYVVVWASPGQDSAADGIYMKIYD